MGIDIDEYRPAVDPGRLRTETKPVDPLRRARFYRVSEMPVRMAEPSARGSYRSLIQFVMCWNDWPDHRSEMLDGPPPDDGDRFHLATIASVVHALCARDGLSVPEWVHYYRADVEATIAGVPATSDFGRIVAAEAPPTCAQHGVYFDYELLEK